jgi:AAA+ ATPase superfamily predicted ATPase
MGGDRNIGGFLKKLEEEYDLIEKKRPIRAKPGSQTVRYEIKDIFLRFWFRYMEKHRTLIEIGNYERLRQIVASDYERYSGKVLERWFMAKLQESQQYDEIGGWWLPDQNDPKEIDIVTVDGQGKVTAYEVKRQRKKYNPALLKDKVEVMQAKNFHHQSIDMGSLTIEDM